MSRTAISKDRQEDSQLESNLRKRNSRRKIMTVKEKKRSLSAMRELT
jgi:hypothetical protein